MSKATLNLLTPGGNRGARALIHSTTADTATRIAAWGFIDQKDGRAEETAAYAQDRFPWLRTKGAVGDGVNAAASAGKHVVVAAALDSLAATIAIADQRRDRTLLQIVGRGPGGPAAGNRLGLAAFINDEQTRSEATLYLRGLQSLTARDRTSSGALTRNGDPLTASLLAPMRDAVSGQTARYLADLVNRRTIEPSLMLFTPAAKHPLAVLEDKDETDQLRSALALEAASRFALPRAGHSVAVAFVNVADQAIRTFFIVRSRADMRRVSGITELRVPARLIVPPAVFTD